MAIWKEEKRGKFLEMEFRQMRYLIEVAECQSVSRAAENLYVSQSAISHYVKHVERELGVRLFDRSTTPLTLTYAGKCYIETAKKILLENEKLSRELRDITEHMTGLLRIGTSRDRASFMMPKLMLKFREKYPGIKVEVVTDSGQKLRKNLREGKIDLLILPDDAKEIPPNVNTEIIYAEELLLVAKKGFITEKKSNLDEASSFTPDGEPATKNYTQKFVVPSELDEAVSFTSGGEHATKVYTRKFIVPSELDGLPFFMQFREHTTRTFCETYFKKNNITPEILMEFPSNITCYRMASAGLGLAIIPSMITKITSSEYEAELFSLSETPQTWNVLVYWRKDAYLGQPEHDLITWAGEIFS